MRSSTRVRKPDTAKKGALAELAAARQKKTAQRRWEMRCLFVRTWGLGPWTARGYAHLHFLEEHGLCKCR